MSDPRDPAPPASDYFEWTAGLFDRAAVHRKPEALRGVRILDLSVIIFGPATADFLGELGAEVIKVEMPGGGDVTRILGGAGAFWKNTSPFFFPQNHSKYHVAIDMHRPEGQALIRKLAARSDVVVENFKAGTLEAKFGLGYRQLTEVNPRLIYVANTGFGQWGPFAEGRASYDGLAQAVSGLTAISGFPGALPTKMGIYIGDWIGACFAALGVLAALHYRDRTGRGQFLEMAQCEALVRTMDWTWVHAGLTGKDRPQTGNHDPAFSPSGAFRCRDGFVALVAGTDGEFRGLTEAMEQPGLTHDPRFATPEARREEAHVGALEELIGAWCRAKTREEVEALGRQHGFAAARVMSARDQYEDPHLRARGAVWELEDPVYGPITDYGPAPKLSGTPARYKWVGPPVGMHNDYIFSRLLGLSAEELRALEEAGVIGKWADRVGPKPPDGWAGEGFLQ